MLLAVVVLIGVTIESAAAATMITVALMIISPILAQTSLMMRLLSSEWSRNLWRVLYYALPKVYGTGQDDAGRHPKPHFRKATSQSGLRPFSAR